MPGMTTTASTTFKSRSSDLSDRHAASRRHMLYLTVRAHVVAELPGLPANLSVADLRDLQTMARARADHRISEHCHRALAAKQAALAQQRAAIVLDSRVWKPATA